MKKLLTFLCTAVVLTALCSCNQAADSKMTETEIMMDTVVTITVWDSDEEVMNGAFDICRKYEKIFSRTIENSDVSKINNSNGEIITVSPETAELISMSLDISEMSDGAFDISILPLVNLWDVNNTSVPPNPQQITEAKAQVGFKSILLQGNNVKLPPGHSIDLGSVAKGYITDKVRDYLLSTGVKKAIINLGGNVTLIGNNNKKEYSVGIQKPFALHGESAAILKLSNKTAVTSGVYERYFEYENKIYHHIIDPKTGYPTKNDIASVTIIADSSALADSLSTACLVLGKEKGMELANLKGVEAIFIDLDGNIFISSGLDIDYNGTVPKISLKF